MAVSCWASGTLSLKPTSDTAPQTGSFPRRSKISCPPEFFPARIKKSLNMDLIVRKASPEVIGDAVASFPIPGGIPGLSLPVGDNPWLAGVAGLLVVVPLMVQRLLTLTKQVDMAAQTVEKIADTVGKVAEEVDKAAENLAESLPEGSLKKVVGIVEDLAEETVKDAQKVEDLMDKVEEMDDKLEEFLNKNFKGSDKA
ncbi:plastid-targeted protein 2 [Striga asiatica]|uniref:Plastid-targeted protein 2 n=1 Tax=Striga asiatica TaxID=4170 RepID=A0A5A7QFW6_STRAF|nr:plastid-targeted protein 2 [Striga asiatica]